MTGPGSRRDSASGLARIAFAGAVWGTIPLMLRAADGASVVKVFYRVVFAAVAVLLWMAATKRLDEVARLPRRKLAQIVGQGVILTLNWFLFFSALDMTNVATAELLGYTGPVFVAALAPFVTGERFDRRIAVPLALSLGGIVVILAPQGLGVGTRRELLGAVFAFCSSLTYATLLLRSKRILRGVSGSTLMLVEYGVAATLLLPFVVVLSLRGQGPSNGRAFAALAVLGLVQTAFAGIVFLGGLRRVRTDRAAILTYAEPVSAVLFASLFLGEPLTAATITGGALVVTGGLLVARLAPVSSVEAPTVAFDRTRPEDG